METKLTLNELTKHMADIKAHIKGKGDGSVKIEYDYDYDDFLNDQFTSGCL